jgi:hypothetical protein
MFIKHKIRKTQRHSPSVPYNPSSMKTKKKTPKSNQTKQRIKGEAATKWGREGLVGYRRLWVVADEMGKGGARGLWVVADYAGWCWVVGCPYITLSSLSIGHAQ